MGKLSPLSAREVVRILMRHGFVEIRRRGSHMIMQAQSDLGVAITVVVLDHKEIPVGTLQSIVRQSGPNRAYFES